MAPLPTSLGAVMKGPQLLGCQHRGQGIRPYLYPQIIHLEKTFQTSLRLGLTAGSDSSWVVVPQPGVPYLHFHLHMLLTASLCLEGSSCLVTSSPLDFISDGFFLPRSDHHIMVTLLHTQQCCVHLSTFHPRHNEKLVKAT